MKFLIILVCSFAFLFTSHAAVSKKYFSDNVQNHFTPHYEPDSYLGFPGKSQNVESIGKLMTSLLHDIYLRAGKGFNIILSPMSIWAILAILLEGAGGKTENELKSKLLLFYNNHDDGMYILRNRYKELLKFNQVNSPTEFRALNFVISDKMKIISPEYKNLIRQYYNGRHFDVDGRDSEKFSRMINMWAAQTTNNKIPNIISPAMLSNLVLVIGNAVYFKSKWKYPFDPSQTSFMPFKDEHDRPIKNVPMMTQVAVLPYAYNARLESEIVEIPYADGLTSMIIILPREKVTLESVLSKMTYLNVDEIIPKNFTEETIQLSIPKFHLVSKMYLNEVLKQDLRSVFSSELAEFPRIGENIFVSKISHRAEIENTEAGTTAFAVTSVQFAYKSSNTVFRANRPFIYLINEMKTKTVLFAGTYSNPFIGVWLVKNTSVSCFSASSPTTIFARMCISTAQGIELDLFDNHLPNFVGDCPKNSFYYNPRSWCSLSSDPEGFIFPMLVATFQITHKDFFDLSHFVASRNPKSRCESYHAQYLEKKKKEKAFPKQWE